ncbi:DUF221-domain-containing protein [Tothia fuscella]|uniref:DUF221-domain-containing protein n=1 Tax=Tothia fuscella TaxID=1048955 RepID=A0A9P4NV91_9PEZI|nr:DUF221-domain-containing protein [Tothia fuscella]
MEHVPTLARLVARAQASQGSATKTSSSASALVSTLIPAFLLALAFFAAFLIIRKKQQRVYAPRTFLEVLPHDARTPGSAKPGMFAWIKEFRALPDEYVLHHQSMDQYLYLRFMKMITIMCFVGCLITWPILFPINATGGGGQKELDLLSFSNVAKPARYFAHAAVAWVFLGFVLFLITRETIFFINLRQAYLTSPLNASRISSRTVLFTDVPKDYQNEGALRRVYEKVNRVWIASDCKKLQDHVDDRDKVAFKLEKAEIKLIQNANKKRLKAKQPAPSTHNTGNEEAGHTVSEWIDQKKRPSHRTKFLIGKKVDTIHHSREVLPGLIEKTNLEQNLHKMGEKDLIGAVFVEFQTQRAAQIAFQASKKHSPINAVPRAIGIIPEQIVWKNLGMGRKNRKLRGLIATAFITAMILFWTIPVAVVGAISNINYLTDKVPFLSFINSVPPVILGVITGLLPTVALAILVALVPIICRVAAKLAGAVTLQEVEMKTQSWYFAFQVIQVFLITTFSSGAAAVATQIVQQPGSAPTLLANSLPKASNFYISYFIVYGLAVSSKQLFNLIALLMFNIVGRLFDKTPRKMYKRWIGLSGDKWGSSYPKWTNLAVIAISYSCIAPLVLGFATIGLGLIYLVIRYQSFYTKTTTIDTRGQAYGRALQQLTVGVYLAELCLIGLFAISIPKGTISTGPMVMMIIFLVGTVIYHIIMRKTLHALTNALPEELLEKTEQRYDAHRDMEEGLQQQKLGHNGAHPLGLDHSESHTTDGQRTPTNGVTHADDDSRNKTKHAVQTTEPTHKEGSFLTKLFNPNRYKSHGKLQEWMSSSKQHSIPMPRYPEEVARDAYQDPSINSETPTLWIPRDEMGISRQELRDGSKVIPMTDEGAWFNEKGKIMWDHDNLTNAPAYSKEKLINQLL